MQHVKLSATLDETWEIHEDGDESDDDEELAEVPTTNVYGDEDEDASTRCPHKALFYHKQLIIADSILLIRSSLAKSSAEMYDSQLAHNVCDAYPNGNPHFPDSDLWLGTQKKDCNCCKDRHHIRTDAPELCQYAEVALRDVQKLDVLLKKLPQFPYSALERQTIESIKARQDWPGIEEYTNTLKDGQTISQNDYDRLRTDCHSMGVTTLFGLLVLYLASDCFSLVCLLDFSHRYIYQQFGLNLLRFLSLPRLGMSGPCTRLSSTVWKIYKTHSTYF